MQSLWSRNIGGHAHLTSREDLLNIVQAGALQPLVTAHVDSAMRSLGVEQIEPWQHAYLAAERKRMTDLVVDWLEVESARQPFEVAEVEKKIDIRVGELALSVRADRIDRVAGGRLLIDYKTGEVSTTSWEGPRPEQPQLPLYAAFGGAEQLIGALFAQVRRPKLVFKGRLDDARSNLLADLKDDDPLIVSPYTPELVDEWRGTLVNLADSFVRGEAVVDPHVYPKTCKFCPLASLCRVAELRGSGAVRVMSGDEDAE
jgi:RecB family exonuclease